MIENAPGKQIEHSNKSRQPEISPHWKLYCLGKDIWNKWAAKKLSVTESQKIIKELGHIPSPEGEINFNNIKFNKEENFSGLLFPTKVSVSNVLNFSKELYLKFRHSIILSVSRGQNFTKALTLLK